VIDYGLLFTCMYPIATSKLIHSEFVTGGRVLLFPSFLRLDWLPALERDVGHSFQYLAVVLFLNRLRESRGYIRSTLVRRASTRGWKLYGLCLGFTLGACLVFLALLALVVHEGWFASGRLVNSAVFGTVFEGQHYFAFYSVALSFLPIHYYFDHFIFLGRDRQIVPLFERWRPAAARASSSEEGGPAEPIASGDRIGTSALRRSPRGTRRSGSGSSVTVCRILGE